MEYVALAILVVAGFAMPRLGRVLLAFAAVGIVGFGVVWGVADLRQRREARAGAAFLRAGLVRLHDATLGPVDGLRGYYTHTLRGRLRNTDSTRTIESLTIRVGVFDCPKGIADSVLTASDCEQVAEGTAHETINVPPLQARDIAASLHLPETNFRGRWVWDFDIDSVRVSRE